jgi:hypothetical protein
MKKIIFMALCMTACETTRYSTAVSKESNPGKQASLSLSPPPTGITTRPYVVNKTEHFFLFGIIPLSRNRNLHEVLDLRSSDECYNLKIMNRLGFIDAVVSIATYRLYVMRTTQISCDLVDTKISMPVTVTTPVGP